MSIQVIQVVAAIITIIAGAIVNALVCALVLGRIFGTYSARIKSIEATAEERKKEIDRRLETIDKDSNSQWKLLHHHTADIGNIQGQLQARAKGHSS